MLLKSVLDWPLLFSQKLCASKGFSSLLGTVLFPPLDSGAAPNANSCTSFQLSKFPSVVLTPPTST